MSTTERSNIMNDDNNRPLAERQAHLYALRLQLGLPAERMNDGPIRFAAVEAPNAMALADLADHALDGGCDIIAAVYASPSDCDPLGYVMIMQKGSFAEALDCVPIEVEPGLPLMMHLRRSDGHVIVDEEGLLARRSGLPVDDIAHAQAAAWHRVKDAAKTVVLPDSAVFERSQIVSRRESAASMVRFH